MPATHETSFTAFHKLSEMHPAFNKRGAYQIGTPDHELMLDFLALDAVASAKATGCKPRKAEQKRADAVVSRLGL